MTYGEDILRLSGSSHLRTMTLEGKVILSSERGQSAITLKTQQYLDCSEPQSFNKFWQTAPIGEDSRVLWVDVMDGHTPLNGPQSKPCWLVLLVLEDAGTAMLVLERTVDFLLSKTYKVM